MSNLNNILKKNLPTHCNFRQKDTLWHQIHPYIAKTQCGIKIDGRREPVKVGMEVPNGGQPCQACAESLRMYLLRKEQQKLNRRFEQHKQWVARTATTKKNTLGRKQQFNSRARTFDMNTPDIQVEE